MEPIVDTPGHVTFASCITDDPVWTQQRREDVAWELIFIGQIAGQALRALDREDVQTDVVLDAICRIYDKAWKAGHITRTVYLEQHYKSDPEEAPEEDPED